MKAILMLVAVQTALIVALFFKVSTIEDAIDESGPLAETSADSLPAELGSGSRDNATPVALSEAAIRTIIREELAAQLGQLPAGGTAVNPGPPISNETPEEYAARRDRVADTIDYYTRVGRISEQEMGRLQVEIARLQEGDRQQMMMELVRAMNEGSLDGRL